MEQEIKLEKALSPTQVTALALGSIVGWGCFVLPGDMFLPQAGPLGTLLGFLAGAILISFVGVCYSYMIKYAPDAGGASYCVFHLRMVSGYWLHRHRHD